MTVGLGVILSPLAFVQISKEQWVCCVSFFFYFFFLVFLFLFCTHVFFFFIFPFSSFIMLQRSASEAASKSAPVLRCSSALARVLRIAKNAAASDSVVGSSDSVVVVVVVVVAREDIFSSLLRNSFFFINK